MDERQVLKTIFVDVDERLNLVFLRRGEEGFQIIKVAGDRMWHANRRPEGCFLKYSSTLTYGKASGVAIRPRQTCYPQRAVGGTGLGVAGEIVIGSRSRCDVTHSGSEPNL